MRKTILLALAFLFLSSAAVYGAERHPLKKLAGELRPQACRTCR